MIARVGIFLPYAFSIPEGEKFKLYETSVDEYSIRLLLPKKSELADNYTGTDSIIIDGVAAFNADVLCIDFQKDEFDRSEKGNDPPAEFIEEIANYFLSRLKYVTGSPHIKPINFKFSSWDMEYLNNDGTELPKTNGSVNVRGSRKFTMSYTPLNKEVWENIHSLDLNFTIPVWRILLIDAKAILPEIGPAIVLIFTALEVFISKTLDEIAATGKVNDELWEWINDRGPLKNPSVEEKYDFLSTHIIGRSIRENDDLWTLFKHIQKARNSFAHGGIAMIGDKVVTEQKVHTFIAKANKIIDFIKEGIPEQLRWPEFKYTIRVEAAKQITKGENKKSSDNS